MPNSHPRGPCRDGDCHRAFCEGYRLGYEEGYREGYDDGYGASSAEAE